MANVRFTNNGEPSYTKQIYDWIVANPQIETFTAFDIPPIQSKGNSIRSAILDDLCRRKVLWVCGSKIQVRSDGSRGRAKIFCRSPEFDKIEPRFYSRAREVTRNAKPNIPRPRSLLTLLQPDEKKRYIPKPRAKQVDPTKEKLNNWISEAETLLEMANDLISKLKKMVNENA